MKKERAAAKIQADLAAYDHVIAQRRIHVRRQTDVLEWITGLASAYITCMHISYDTCAELEPVLYDAHEEIVRVCVSC